MTEDADNNAVPDKRELRQFGIGTGAMIALLFGVLIPWIWNFSYPVWPWVTLAVLAVWAMLAPASLQPVHKWWMRFALLLSKITTPILLGAVFLLVFVPVGILFRILSRDSLRRKFEPDASTYRVKADVGPTESLDRPY